MPIKAVFYEIPCLLPITPLKFSSECTGSTHTTRIQFLERNVLNHLLVPVKKGIFIWALQLKLQEKDYTDGPKQGDSMSHEFQLKLKSIGFKMMEMPIVSSYLVKEWKMPAYNAILEGRFIKVKCRSSPKFMESFKPTFYMLKVNRSLQIYDNVLLLLSDIFICKDVYHRTSIRNLFQDPLLTQHVCRHGKSYNSYDSWGPSSGQP